MVFPRPTVLPPGANVRVSPGDADARDEERADGRARRCLNEASARQPCGADGVDVLPRLPTPENDLAPVRTRPPIAVVGGRSDSIPTGGWEIGHGLREAEYVRLLGQDLLKNDLAAAG